MKLRSIPGVAYRWLKSVVFLALDTLVRAGPHRRRDDLLVLIRLDMIGDFVLWLDSASHFRALYPGRRIVLVANESWAALAQKLPYWDDVLPVNLQRLRREPRYRLRTLRAVRQLGAGLIIQPTYSRALLDGDALVRVSGAMERIGYQGDFGNITPFWREVADRWYTRLVPAVPGPRMEIERNADFVAALGCKAGPQVASFPILVELTGRLKIPGSYFVLFPGASWAGTRWPPQKFAMVLREVESLTGWIPVICGTADEKRICQEVVIAAGSARTVNLAGQTGLAELVEVLRCADLLVSNDTSAVHIAAAVGTPVICVLGGGHHGRFAPYSAAVVGHKPMVISHWMECFGCDWRCKFDRGPDDAVPCVDHISVAAVMQLAREIIHQP